MNKHFLLILLFIFPVLVSGQSVFEKYQNSREVISISINPKMFQLLGAMSLSSSDPEDRALIDMIKGITSFRALITDKELISNDINLWVKHEAIDKNLNLIVSLQELNTDLSIYVKEDDSEEKLKSLLMFSNGVFNSVPEAQTKGKKIEAVVLLIEGNLEIDKIAKLISKMDLPGGKQLTMSGI